MSYRERKKRKARGEEVDLQMSVHPFSKQLLEPALEYAHEYVRHVDIMQKPYREPKTRVERVAVDFVKKEKEKQDAKLRD